MINISFDYFYFSVAIFIFYLFIYLYIYLLGVEAIGIEDQVIDETIPDVARALLTKG